ncbi:MAG: hypothetical protein ABSB67_18800 [Bryobacteraceae bacterium]
MFERGSAGGQRIELKAKDDVLGIDILLEIENRTFRQMRQIVFVEEAGTTYHLPIIAGSRPEELLAAYKQLGAVPPYGDVRIFYAPDEKEWVEHLIQEAWPKVTFREGSVGSTRYGEQVARVGLTDRYFRAVAKIGFHYFLTQFSEYSGHEQLFSGIRGFIAQDGTGVEKANEFVGERQNPLLGEMWTPGVRPDGWRAHALCAETRPGECLAYVQTFVTEDWRAPVYAVRLAQDAGIVDCRATGHAYMYFDGGPQGKFIGETLNLETTRATWVPPPFAPVVKSA